MLCGTPVISLARGSALEVVDRGVTGWVVDDLDEMTWRLAHLAARPERFDRERCRARAVKRFSAEVMTDNYLALYAAAIQRRRPGRSERAYP
jgi:glycosyltransferase involved in cell wall biosynthesis